MEKEATINSHNTFAIGIDVGGTTVKGGIVGRSGAMSDRIKVDARGKEGPAVVIGVIRSVIDQLLASRNRADCAGIGIGCPGIVSEDGDSVSHPPNLYGWEDVKLATELKKHFALPVVVENDANSAALAEATFGAGKEHKDFLFVIWGTGVGGGIVYNHKIFHGPHGGAGEIGHTSIDHNGPICNCGGRGCIESYIGQRYLSERARGRIKNEKDSILRKLVNGDLGKIEPALIAAAAEQGDAAAK
ncbi:MAG TPA: ROK family protein, partial [Bacteroidota bacterium]|nr:ROK family protein [Bacteroidota bacterium]